MPVPVSDPVSGPVSDPVSGPVSDPGQPAMASPRSGAIRPEGRPQIRPEIRPEQYALIIGAMKCATTSLFAYLAEHPAIAPSTVKEPEFFSRHQGHRHPVARYEDLWPDFDPERHRFAMEGSTGYTKFHERGAAATIRAHGLRPRLLYIVRDPFDRIESHYNFMLQDPAWNFGITDPGLVQTSNYWLFADEFARAFGRENLLLLDYETLSRDPRAAVNAACGFLGLEPLARLAAPEARNVTELPRSGLERRLRRLLPDLGRAAPEAVKAPVRRALAALRPDKSKLTPAERARVKATLAPDMARLQAEFGVDVGKWGF
ncbi:MAG TPA: sulfotransferase domain-containing protein [Amaricoccus sp.]|nr:sulfotransferase domain-containing protein [Amaricoccus sp.]